MRSNAMAIRECMRFEGGFIYQLTTQGVITHVQAEQIETIPPSARIQRATTLLDMIQMGVSEERLELFVSVLRKTKQHHIALCIESGGEFYIVTCELSKVGLEN